MTIHYHGTPITPRSELYRLAGRHFCVSYAHPSDVEVAHKIGQSVMLDNGAFSLWRRGKAVNWDGYLSWADAWLRWKTTWAVIPDVIDGTVAENDAWVWSREWSNQWAPVWHMHEDMRRLDQLCRHFYRVCIGSSGDFSTVGTERWHRRMSETMNFVCRSGEPPCWLHMMRGMSLSGSHYPFASVDSTDIARNHHLKQKSPIKMADLWDSQQCSGTWRLCPEQPELEGMPND